MLTIDTKQIYHGGYSTIATPQIIKSKHTKDFGEGFYCTEIKEQAKRWCLKYDSPTITTYSYIENSSLNILEFDIMSEEWLDFIVACRRGLPHNYDIVIGAMADDQVYNFITDFMDGIISREAFWALAKFKYPTHQIVFCTDKALACLQYLQSEKVEKDGV